LVDVYTHNVAIVSVRNQPSTGTRYLVAGPGWKGQAPAGVSQVIRSESQFVFALVRIGVSGTEDIPAAAAIQDRLTLSPLDASLPIQSLPLEFPPYDPHAAQQAFAAVGGMSLRLLKFSGGSVDDYAICFSS
jgi:hypothetical protein